MTTPSAAPGAYRLATAGLISLDDFPVEPTGPVGDVFSFSFSINFPMPDGWPGLGPEQPDPYAVLNPDHFYPVPAALRGAIDDE